MISKTKFIIDNDKIKLLFHAAGIDNLTDIAPLGDGEYNAVFSVKASDREYVLKIAPTDDIPVLTYEKDMLQSEVYWYEMMKKYTTIRIPEIYFKDFSRKLIPTNYFIMEKLSGKALNTIKLSDYEKTEVAVKTAQMAAKIHKIKNEKSGYIQNELFDDWYQAIRAMTSVVISDCKRMGRTTKRGEKLLRYIDKHKDILKSVECCMVNFDIWPPNIIAERKNGELQLCWIDPERSYWGDRIVDFVCLEMLKPFKNKTISITAYNQEADIPVKLTDDESIRFAISLAYLAALMETEKYFRYTPHHFGWWRNVAVSYMYYKNAFKILESI